MKPQFPACSIDLCGAVLLGALLTLPPERARADDAPTLVLMQENDSVKPGSDKHYTEGIYASWTGMVAARNDGWTNLARRLMLPGAANATWRDGYFLGQAIFTPEDLAALKPPANDRPYAGWLFGGVRLYRDSGNTLDRIEGTFGVVGPASLAGDLQRWWHATGLFGGFPPRGWHYQLRDELGLVLSEQRIWRVAIIDGPLAVEALPEANLSLGNIYTYAGAGGMLRLGHGLASDWGPPRIAPAEQGADFQQPHGLAWYLFVGFESRAVARNIFLDGNSFEASPSVAKETLVTDLNAGAALLLPPVRLTASYTIRGKEFQGQRREDQVGSFTLAFRL